MSTTTYFYEQNAKQLAEQYDSLEFELVHQSWRAYWPVSGSNVLDVGAGSGRDVRWFCERGCSVWAVEPTKNLCQIGMQNSPKETIWLDDTLPALRKVMLLSVRYNLVVLSAVWMHLSADERATAISVLSDLLTEDGNLVVTLRHGEFNDGRETFGVSVTELEALGNKAGLRICYIASGEDVLKRDNVKWETVVMKKVPALGR